MSVGMTLLKDAQDWRAYREAFLDNHKLPEDGVVWGHGPKAFPCLVASCLLPALNTNVAQILSCYVFPEDARRLLEAAGQVQQLVGPRQDEFNRQVSAHLLALTNVMVETGIIKEEQFLKRLHGFHAFVDQVTQESHDELKGERKFERELLDRLGPEA